MGTMTLVCDSGSSIVVPGPMGQACDGQLVGAWWEQLAELAGRVCYDSLGKGRNSEEYHRHIQEVKHLSVYEHCVFCIPLTRLPMNYRPGVYWTRDRIWFNIRTLLEWDNWHLAADPIHDEPLYAQFYSAVAATQPHFVRLREPRCALDVEMLSSGWRTYYIRCSRACSHELVRHGDFTAISQRSTRYCREELTTECLHPLLVERDIAKLAQETAKLYQKIYDQLNGAGVPLKQARGAARQLLPHYLTTELIFSASSEQWDRIRAQRVSEAADAEIRELIGDGLK